MASGKMVSLAIPVLASIYRGLHFITIARYPSNSGGCFPVHYLLGWIGTYLRVYSPLKNYPPGPYMARFGGVYRHLSFSLLEAYWLGQSVTFPSASKAHGSCKGYSAWLESVFSGESSRFAPLRPGKGKSAPRLPSSVISSSSKPLKKRYIPKDDPIDRDPKHAKWGTTRRPGPVESF
ncbi:hypothetical protein LIER_21173 [Lithospermum erythrorhizon]|uniref:Aminotransferase-like plant mobile domain-containing protein n=1 Tax=Lithospermum erythrorhizon TaxID=34254 RepID=A0AAV3QSE6_LITER